MPQWFFPEQRKSDVRRDPIESEYFKHDQENEADYDGVDNLVREVLQNSLDAAVDTNSPIRVRFAIYDHSKMPNKERLQVYFDRLKAPMQVCDSSFDFENATEGFLVCEDFGTRGLEGDVGLSSDPKTSEPRQDFFWFWRNVARSAKSEGTLGRWGIGKAVYHRASRIGCFLGLTVRQSDVPKTYLMGQAILKIHEHNGKEYIADGFWGDNDSGMILPVTDKKIIEQFRREWDISRHSEPGLSVIVPFVDSGLNKTNILQAVAVHFFEKILQGLLIVEIETPNPNDNVILASDSIAILCKEIQWDGNKKFKRHTSPPIAFIAECLACKRRPLESKLLGVEKIPGLTKETFDEDSLNTAREQFESGYLVAVKIRLQFSKKNGRYFTDIQDTFDVFVQKTDDKTPDSYFVREGMTIPKPNSSKAKQNGVRGYVRIQKNPDSSGSLASLLGDAEGPAHEDWNTSEKRIQQNWKTGAKGRIEFIKKIVDSVYSVLNPPLGQADSQFLSGYFSIPEHSGTIRSRKDTTLPIPVIINESPKWYRVDKRPCG
ncbi:MAG: hypothetical protein LBT89_12450, partial [Planctomycetaceae bacterium]|nr:hypothetical protein [Planctomycetaceae bacterium]